MVIKMVAPFGGDTGVCSWFYFCQVLFFGDSAKSDIYPSSVVAKWDVVAVLEEMEVEGMVTTCYEQVKHDSKSILMMVIIKIEKRRKHKAEQSRAEQSRAEQSRAEHQN